MFITDIKLVGLTGGLSLATTTIHMCCEGCLLMLPVSQIHTELLKETSYIFECHSLNNFLICTYFKVMISVYLVMKMKC